MTRLITTIALVIGLAVVVAPATTYAQAPSAKDLAAAKKAFGEGKKLHDEKPPKLLEAIEKFKLSYQLSKNPLLLYNIALTMQEAGSNDIALFYFRKFLTDAPADAAQRPDVEERVKALEKQFNPGGTPTPPVTPDPTKPDPVKPENKPPVTIKPAGTYSATDFQHQIVMEAPPSKPLDVTAFVPEDSGWTVTLFFRGAGDTKFYVKPMKWRYKELVARIPGQKMGGQSIQYYVEVKDQANVVVTRSGKSTSPNLVGIEQTATARFYPDWTDDGQGVAATPTEIKKKDNEEDPLNHKGGPVENPVIGPTTPTDGPTDTFATSSKFKYAKWGTTIGAATLLAASMVFYLQAGSYATALSDDTGSCGAPPCHPFDTYDQSLQDKGQRFELFSRISLGVGIASAGVAGYLWYRGMKAKSARPPASNSDEPSPAAPAAKPAAHDEFSWIVTPAVGDGYAGAAALMRF